MNLAYFVLFLKLVESGFKITNQVIKWATIIGCAEVLSVVLEKWRRRDSVTAFTNAVKEAVKNKD